MALTQGTSLGVYRVGVLLGKGGMGEVYRARDEKLGRDVALKVLPDEFAADPDRFARFEREARLLASLNHPNIAGIHGLEESGRTHFLILELVEGETLAERMKRPLSIEQSLRLCLQIATGLEAAHARGIVHRDLKPSNIKVAPDGTVKVLDFGLARGSELAAADADLSHSPTMSVTAATAKGVILGTAGYMAPEQARGEVATKQVDIWALGCILFEMLSGKRIWQGRSVTDVIASLVAREPDWASLPPGLHPRVRFALERCLEKDAADRYRDVADVRLEIAKALATPGAVVSATSTPAGRPRSMVWIARATVALLIALGGAGYAGWFLKPAETRQVARFSVDFPEPTPLSSLPPFPALAVSRDGARWALSTVNSLYIRNLNEAEPRRVQGLTSQALASPTFSPDGTWLAYVDVPTFVNQAGMAIKKVPVSGGTPQTVVPLKNVLITSAMSVDVRWDDRDMLTWVEPAGIMQVSPNGGNSELIVKAGKGETIGSPQVLPGGKAVLYTVTTAVGADRWDSAQVVVEPLGSGQRSVVWRGGRDAKYVATGHIIFAQGATLYALPFDLVHLKVAGVQVPLVEGLYRTGVSIAGDTAQFAVSDAGLLLYATGGATVVTTGESSPPRTLAWVDRKGQETQLPLAPADYTMARISPDGTKVALVTGNAVNANSSADIWLYDLLTGSLRQLTFNKGDDDAPVWTADSKRIYFRSSPPGDESLSTVYWMSADGGMPTKVASSPDYRYAMPWALSPDGRTLTLVSGTTQSVLDLATLDVTGQGRFHDLLKAGHVLAEPAISPNGHWVAYYDFNGTPPPEISMRSYPDVERQRYPVASGAHAVFSRNGSELFFFDSQGISVVPLAYEPGLRIGKPQQLFKGQYWYGVAGPNGQLGRAWDVHPKGDRFLMVQMPGRVAATGETKHPPPLRVNVVLNWLDEVKARAH